MNLFSLQANFLIGNNKDTTNTIYLIDFGLCKKINKRDGVIIKV
jgi:hypothetical protein